MVYKVLYTKVAEKDLDKLDKTNAIRILKKVNQYVELDNPLKKVKK